MPTIFDPAKLADLKAKSKDKTSLGIGATSGSVSPAQAGGSPAVFNPMILRQMKEQSQGPVFDPDRFNAVKQNPAEAFEQTRLDEIKQGQMKEQLVVAEQMKQQEIANDPNTWTLEKTQAHFKANPPQTPEDEAAAELMIEGKKKQKEQLKQQLVQQSVMKTLAAKIAPLVAGATMMEGTGGKPVNMEPERPRELFLSEAKGKPVTKLEIPPEQQFIDRVSLFTDGMVKSMYTPEQLESFKTGERRQDIFMKKVVPAVTVGVYSPLFAIGYEGLQQLKNNIVSGLKNEKLDWAENRLLSELLPDETPVPLKIAAGGAEMLGDVAMMGGLANLAKRGLLKEALTEVSVKLEKAGYGTGKRVITEEVFDKAVRGTSLEDAVRLYAEANKLKVPQVLGRRIGPAAEAAGKTAGEIGREVVPAAPKFVSKTASQVGLEPVRLPPEYVNYKPSPTATGAGVPKESLVKVAPEHRAFLDALAKEESPEMTRKMVEEHPYAQVAEKQIEELGDKPFEEIPFEEVEAKAPDYVKKYLQEQGGEKLPKDLPTPEAVVIIGPPGAGKSDMAQELASKGTHVTIDSDVAKEYILKAIGKVTPSGDPDLSWAPYVHEESSQMAKLAIQRAISEGKNIVLPKVGNNPESIRKILQDLTREGYRTKLVLADLPPHKAAQRAFHRYLKHGQYGRYIRPKYIFDEVGLKPKETYAILKAEQPVVAADAFIAYNADVPYGEKPQIVEGGEHVSERKPETQPKPEDGGPRYPGHVEGDRGGRPVTPAAKAPAPAKIKPAENLSLRSLVRRHGKISIKKALSAGYTYQDFKEAGLISLLSKEGRGVDDIAGELISEGHLTVSEDDTPSDVLMQALKANEVSATQAMKAADLDVKLSQEPETAERINKTQIIRWVEKTFGIPVKGKATHHMREAAGWYMGHADLIRLKKWGGLEYLAHEVAHKIYAAGSLNLSKAGKDAIKELQGLDYKPDRGDYKEGFAEFIRHYVSTELAAAKAPIFYRYFVDTILKNNPDLAAKIEKFRRLITVWHKQGAEERITQQIDWRGEHTRPIRSKVERARDWILKNFDDEFYTIRKVQAMAGIPEGSLRPTEDPFVMATYFKSKSGVVARTFVEDKAIDRYGKILGPGLKEILEPIGHKDMRSFISYAVAKRAVKLAERNIESGFDEADTAYILEKYKDRGWDAVTDELTKWSNHLLDWVVQSGGLTEEAAALMRELNPVYLPFKRAFVDELKPVAGVGQFVDQGAAVKRIRGSGRPIINPIESMIAQATELIAKAQKIEVARLVAEMALKKGVGGIITPVPPPMEALKFPLRSIKDLEKLMVEMGIPEEEVASRMANLDMDQFLTAFTQGTSYKGKDNIVSIWRDGKRKFYEIHPDLYAAMKGLDIMQTPAFIKILAAPFARLLRLGATGLKVSFGLARNPFRDAFTYALFSKNPKAMVWDPLKGYYLEMKAKPEDLVWRFKKTGGSLSGMMGLDREATMATYDEMLADKLGKMGKVLKVAKHPIDTLRGILSFTELAPRSVELENSYKRYQKEHPEWSEEDAFVAAFNDAQDVTVNFTKSGYWAKRINEFAAFFNVSIRGPEKLFRAARANPWRLLAKGIVSLTIPALMLWDRNRKKQWFKNLPPSYKYNNFFIELDDGVIVRLPVPFELGMLFAAVPQAAADYYETEDPVYLQGLLDMGKMQMPDWTPTVVGPLIEVMKNRNFLNQPIESAGMQFLPVTQRKNAYTSQVSIHLSKALNAMGTELSPIQIDYMMNAYTGGWANQLPFRPMTEPADIPVIGDLLTRMPENPRRQLNQFFSDYERLAQLKHADQLKPEDTLRQKRTQLIYNQLTGVYFKNLKKYREKRDIEGMRRLYETMTDYLARNGYD